MRPRVPRLIKALVALGASIAADTVSRVMLWLARCEVRRAEAAGQLDLFR